MYPSVLIAIQNESCPRSTFPSFQEERHVLFAV
jgi:hypothetical protein